MKTIIHIGADKCGSTSIQKFFTLNPELSSNFGKLKYASLEKNSQNIYIGNEIKNLINKQNKIVTNTNLPNLKNFTNDEIGLIKRRITREKSDLIFFLLKVIIII